jgi:hypothetical protein
MQTVGNNRPYVPLQYDTNHARSNTTVNTQTPTPLGGPARQPVGANNPVTLGLQNKINQGSTDSMTRTLTGVTVERHGTSTDFFGANSKPFNNFGDALGNVRANDPTR